MSTIIILKKPFSEAIENAVAPSLDLPLFNKISELLTRTFTTSSLFFSAATNRAVFPSDLQKVEIKRSQRSEITEIMEMREIKNSKIL